ncbi:MAG: Na(+)-translocating NADH-quinone reductase subunit C [Desulfobulbaceae bacterium]|nr:Na(+)-translocating NADH-quinone reductase subunit C [Desulfobulbaceae bacterium]
MADESAAKPFYSVLVLAFVCSLLVSWAAIGLRPLQEENRQLDMKKNILRAAGLYEPDKSVDELFANIETRIIELASGEFVPEERVSPESYDQLKAALQTDSSRSLDRDEDIAGLGRLEKYAPVFLVRSKNGFEQIILPIRGKGLWSTLHGYVALDADLNTIRGISFYEHGETPGLGGEIENEQWRAGWEGKKLYGPDEEVRLRVVKGSAPATGEAAQHEVDGLSGATMTAEGVNDLMHFWFGDHGFKTFIERLQKTGGLNG